MSYTKFPVRTLAYALGVTVLAGCAITTPSSTSNPNIVPTDFPVTLASSAGAVQAATLSWKEFLSDRTLTELVSAALEHNQEVTQAALRMEKARVLVSLQEALNAPSVGTDASVATRGANSIIQTTTSLSAGMHEFELDYFKKKSSLSEKAWQAYLGAEQTLKAAQSALVLQTSQAYVHWLVSEEKLNLASHTLTSHQSSFELINKTYQLGASSLLAVTQAKTLVESAKRDKADYEQRRLKALNALTLLTGKSSPELEALLPKTPKALNLTAFRLSVPSEVLLSRPDIKAAEANLAAANADIAVARAALYPSITISVSAQTQSTELSSLFGSGSGVWQFMPKISLPIFNRDRLKAQVQVSEIDEQIAQSQYEHAIQTAFKEVADLLAERSTVDERIAAQRELVAALEKSVTLAKARYDQGLDPHLTVLDAQRGVFSAKTGLIDLLALKQSNLLALYSALGGGV